MYRNLNEKSRKSNSYRATTIKFQALGTTYSRCLSCYIRKHFFGPISLPFPSHQVSCNHRQNKKTAFWLGKMYLHFS